MPLWLTWSSPNFTVASNGEHHVGVGARPAGRDAHVYVVTSILRSFSYAGKPWC